MQLAAVLLLSVLLSSAQQQDQAVLKVFPANIVCRRNQAQRIVERQEALEIGGSVNMLVDFHYSYACMHAHSCNPFFSATCTKMINYA